jgi:hypothetical protein
MQSPLTVLIPAAGSSQRFVDAGIAQPKGLIRFAWGEGKPQTMVENVSRGISTARRWIGVSKGNDWHGIGIDVVTTGETEGQAETLHKMIHLIGLCNEPVLILNSDCGFTYPLSVFVRQAQNFSAAALVFRSRSRAYSYVDGMPVFRSAQEKNPISRWAMAGAYYWRSATELSAALVEQHMAGAKHGEEYYLSGAFDYMDGAMLAVPMERAQWHCWGTPEDLARDPDVQIEDPAIEAILRRLR